MVNMNIQLAGMQVNDVIRKQVREQFKSFTVEEKLYTCAKCKKKFLESQMVARPYVCHSNTVTRRLCKDCDKTTIRRGKRRNT